MFVCNKYTKWYNSIVFAAKHREELLEETELHHVIPKSLGGSDDAENLVRLSIREHFVCHWLLTKMVTGNNFYKMGKALHKMCQGRKLFSRYYEVARKANIKCMKENNPTKQKCVRDKIKEAHIGKTHTTDTKKKMSENHSKYWSGKSSPRKGFVFYNNGVEQKMFLEGTQPESWVKGRLNKPWNYGRGNK